MSCVYVNNSGTIDTATMYYNNNGSIINENDIDIWINNNGTMYKMPQKESMLLNIDAFSFKTKSCRGKNFMLNKNYLVRVKSTNQSNFATNQTTQGNFGDFTVATEKGILWLPKAQNQHNFVFNNSIFDGTQSATLSMTFQANNLNNTDGFFFILEVGNIGVGINSNSNAFVLKEGSTILATSSQPMVLGNIYNVTLAFSQNSIKMYQDGVEVASVAYSGTFGTTNKVWVNGYPTRTGIFSDIGIWSVRVWDGATLSAQEVSDMIKFDFF